MSDHFKTLGEGDFAISVDYLVAISEFASECGMTPQQVLKDSSIPLNALINSNVRIRHGSMQQVILNVINGLDDPLLAIKYGKRLTISRHGVLGFAIQSSQSLLDAASVLKTFIQTRSGGGDELVFEVIGDSACLSVQAINQPLSAEVGLFNTLSTFISIETISRWLAGKTQQHVDTEILLTFDAPCEIPEDILSPGLTIKFNQDKNVLRCPLDYLQEPLASANPSLFDEAKKECEIELVQLSIDTDITTKVRTLFRNHVNKTPTIDLIADEMNMSPRTLKRKLHDANTSYQKIKDSERFTRAIGLLENTKNTVEQIANALGYSDASNFTKAFKNWAEMSPNEYRIQVNSERG
ncbi:MAG: hypothetical protein COA99_05825 [Moraxellaceae bacterium]|nr:MAG: hypothetical protein COA99_05825 [Moraxellaceae bacterium]